MDVGGLEVADRQVEGVVEMMLDATRHYDQPLTGERVFAWHANRGGGDLFLTVRPATS